METNGILGTLWMGIGLGAYFLALTWINVLLGSFLSPLFIVPMTWLQDKIVAKPALQPKAGNAEIGILVGLFQVARVERRFRNAPRHLVEIAILDMAADDPAFGAFQQAAGRWTHDQRRHEIFEHRTRPGHQYRSCGNERDGMA